MEGCKKLADETEQGGKKREKVLHSKSRMHTLALRTFIYPRALLNISEQIQSATSARTIMS